MFDIVLKPTKNYLVKDDKKDNEQKVEGRKTGTMEIY